MKKYILALSVLLFAITGYSQTLSITDKKTGENIPGATVYSEKPKVSALTNAKGQVDISAFKGAEKMEIRMLGYKIFVGSYSELESSGFSIMLETANVSIDEVVISSSRWEQSSANIPSKIISISSKSVTLQNPQTAADLLGTSGKVFIQKSQQGGGSPMIRGFATNRLVYTVDGVRMNTAIFRSGNIQNVINIDPFATERTEVLFGPGSVIYGSDAIGGVMSFQTITPQLSLDEKPLITGKAITRYSSANKEKTAHFDVNLGWKKWSLVTSISAWDFDHLRQGKRGPSDYLKTIHVVRMDSIDRVVSQDDPLLQVPTAYSQINMMQKIRFRPNEKWDVQYGFHYSETSDYGRYDRHNRMRNGTARYAEWNYGPQIWMMNNLNITHNGQHAVYDQMSIKLAHQFFEESRIDRTLNKNDRNTQTEKVQAYSANLDFGKSFGKKNTLFYGAEYVINEVTSLGKITDISTGTDAAGPSRYPQAKWTSIAVYLNNEFRVSEKFTLNGGLRYNQYMLNAQFDTTFYPFPFTTSELNNGALTGSIGAIFRPAKSWVISANLGTAFRSPNVDDLGKVFDSEPGAVTVPNPNLKAEYAYNVDFGIAKIFSDMVKIDVAAYYTMLQNALVRRNFQLNGLDSIMYDGEMSQVQAIQNAAVATVYGVQAGLELKLPCGFYFSSDINWQVGEEELDDGTKSPSRHAAPLFGVSRVGFNVSKLDLQVYLMHQAKRTFDELPQEEKAKDEIYAKDADGNNYSPGWYTLNFKAMYQFAERFTVSAGVENITNQRYRPYSSGISGAGRNFVASLKIGF